VILLGHKWKRTGAFDAGNEFSPTALTPEAFSSTSLLFSGFTPSAFVSGFTATVSFPPASYNYSQEAEQASVLYFFFFKIHVESQTRV
jgi:hypothetical protein